MKIKHDIIRQRARVYSVATQRNSPDLIKKESRRHLGRAKSTLQVLELPNVSFAMLNLHCYLRMFNGIFVFSTASDRALKPTQPPNPGYGGEGCGALTPRLKRPGIKLITYLHLLSKLKTYGAIPPLPQYVFMA
jgi:hypothetical protein